MKRAQINNGVDAEAGLSKHRKTDSDSDVPTDGLADDSNAAAALLEPHASEFEGLQYELQRIDEECAKEQIQIQKTFDQKKRPLFDKRQKLIEKIPNFWGRTLRMHRALISMVRDDEPILKHLQKIDLDDNLDDNGSYKVTFVFDEGARKYMSPLTLVKHVKFSGENTEEEIVEATSVQWKDTVAGEPYTNPVDVVKARRDSGNDDNGEDPWSIFEWFSQEPWTDHPDVGEVIRREIWHSPLIYYMEQDFIDEEDLEDDDDDEDEDAGEDIDEGDEEEIDDSEE